MVHLRPRKAIGLRAKSANWGYYHDTFPVPRENHKEKTLAMGKSEQIRCLVFYRLRCSKIAVRATLSPLFDVFRRIRIPPSPPDSLDCREITLRLAPKYVKHARFRDNSQTNRTAEKDCLPSRGLKVSPFLWRAEWQSGFDGLLQANAMRSRVSDRLRRG